MLAGLTGEQRDAVTTRATPLCIIAGAGSGKTRVLTTRIAWQADQGRADPRRMLAVTFTRRAARELRARLRRLGLNDAVSAGTFHAIALAQLRRHAADNSQRPPRILAGPRRLIAELRPRSSPKAITDTANEIGWAKARLVTPERYPAAAKQAGRRPPAGGADRFAQLYADYESAKHRQRMLDFDDVLADALDLMTTQPRHAAARRWLHQHVLVDEFQDINPLQFALLRSWLGPDSTLLAVGDPDQAIYGWNGADPELIGNVAEHFAGCAVLHLRTNFRSTPEVLEAAGRVAGKAPQPSVRPSGKVPEVTVCDGADEAAVLVRAVRRRHRPGAPWRRQAVLARTNDQLIGLRQALERQNIPVVSQSDGSLLERAAVATLLGSWPEGASLSACLADCRGELHAGDARADVEALLELAQDHLTLEPDATVGAFRATLSSGDRPAASSDGVNLLTFHSAKGLQWPVVHIVGLEDGLVPIAHARSAAARAEERRLLYVAVTRAEQELHAMWCPRRDVAGRSVERDRSPWLDAIASAADAEGRPDRVDPLEAVTTARRALPPRPERPA